MSILKMPWPRNGHLHFYNLLKEHWRWIQRTMFHLDYEKRAKGLPLSTHFDFCNSQNVSKTRTPDSNFYSLVLNLFARWMVPPWNVNFKLSQTSPADQTKYNFIMIRLFHFQLKDSLSWCAAPRTNAKTKSATQSALWPCIVHPMWLATKNWNTAFIHGHLAQTDKKRRN